MSNSLRFHGLKPTRLLYPWNFPGKNIGMGSHSLLERIFPTQGLNPGLLHCRGILYHLSHMIPFQVPPMEWFSPFSSVQSLSHVRLFATPWTAAHQASLSLPSPGAAQTHVHWVSDAIQPPCPLFLPSPPTLNLSQPQGLFHTTVGSSKLWRHNTLINSFCLCYSHPSELPLWQPHALSAFMIHPPQAP